MLSPRQIGHPEAEESLGSDAEYLPSSLPIIHISVGYRNALIYGEHVAYVSEKETAAC